MNHYARRSAPFVTTACAALLSIVGGAALAATDRDTQEISHYVLTDAGLAKFSAATQSLGKLGQSVKSCDDDADSPSSLDKLVAKADATPGVKSAIQSAGMTTREYVVFTMSLFQAGVAAWGMEQAGGKLPPGVSKANVDFYKAHKDAIDKLSAGTKDKCGDSGNDRDSGDDRDSEQ
jgi:hypothetical protein